jgi:thiol-disulfide isomerase/thioredoxin
MKEQTYETLPLPSHWCPSAFTLKPPRMKILKWIFAGAGVLVVLAFGLFVWSIYAIKNPDLPKTLPELAQEVVMSADGKPVKISSLVVAGKPTILTFWASWCGQCYGEAKEIQRLRNRFGPDKLNIIYLNGEPKDAVDQSEAKAFVRDVIDDAAIASSDKERPPLTYHFANPQAYLAISGTALIVFPRTYVFDRAGKPVKASTGYDPDQIASELTPAVEALMRKTG